ncbi:hypothetical protein BN1095_20093 [Clostridioides difficile]|uniref:Uncharacterized protein n=1 Tax=Clostridioides difficile TaxID=1496 RepID=A0A069AP26_CLODI|nr:hypothetical protein BN188_1880029 [Clostridioides difficile T19]CDS94818.1 hypothetical protein BN1095_20093 [Clostridioides difficile]
MIKLILMNINLAISSIHILTLNLTSIKYTYRNQLEYFIRYLPLINNQYQ